MMKAKNKTGVTTQKIHQIVRKELSNKIDSAQREQGDPIAKYFGLMERVLIAETATCVLIVVAAVSALPAANCAALAKAYFDGIAQLGAVAIAGATFTILVMFSTQISSHHKSILIAICAVLLVAFSINWFGGLASASRNVSSAVRYCFASDEQKKSGEVVLPPQFLFGLESLGWPFKKTP